MKKERCLQEFHYSNFCFTYHNQDDFVFSPWLPKQLLFQWIYVLYRCILALFFILYLIFIGINSESNYLIYLTNWSYLIQTTHLLWSACSVTFVYIRWLTQMKKQEKQQLGTECMWAFRPHSEVPRPTGCCGINTNALAWFQIVQWVLLTLGTSIPIIVVLLFWTTIPPPTDTDIGSGQNSTSNGYAHFSFHTHLTNGIIAVVDVWASAIPFRVYHFVYVSVFAGTYGLFTVIYFFAGGTGADGEPYIYGVLDYGSNPGLAVSLLLISILVISPIIHCLVYENYLMRQWLFSVFKALGNKRCKDGKHSESHEMVT